MTDDKLAEIRARHEAHEISSINTLDDLHAAHADRATLLRLLDEAAAREARLREALEDIARGDYSDPFGRRTPEARARDALAPEDTQP